MACKIGDCDVLNKNICCFDCIELPNCTDDCLYIKNGNSSKEKCPNFLKKKQIYQVGLHDNYDRIETYVVAASSSKEAEVLATKVHLDIFPPEIYEDIEITIDSIFVITKIYGADNVKYNIYLVEKTPPVATLPTFGDITELSTIGELAHIFPDQEQTPISKLLEVIEQGIPR